MRERLFAPLRLSAAGTLPEEALLWGAAVGHFGTEITPQWGLPRSAGPSGLIHARAADLVTFARMHLAGGVNATGDRVVSADAVKVMRSAQVAIPEPWTSGSHVGLSWMLFDWGRPVIGHDGVTLGQNAYLRIAPDPVRWSLRCLSMVATLSSCTKIFSRSCSPSTPAPLQPSEESVVSDTTYERALMSFDVQDRDGELALIVRPSGVLTASLGTDQFEVPLIPFAPSTFLIQIPGRPGWLPSVFYQVSDGTRYLHLGGEAA
jgi:hypothetical protein